MQAGGHLHRGRSIRAPAECSARAGSGNRCPLPRDASSERFVVRRPDELERRIKKSNLLDDTARRPMPITDHKHCLQLPDRMPYYCSKQSVTESLRPAPAARRHCNRWPSSGRDRNRNQDKITCSGDQHSTRASRGRSGREQEQQVAQTCC